MIWTGKKDHLSSESKGFFFFVEFALCMSVVCCSKFLRCTWDSLSNAFKYETSLLVRYVRRLCMSMGPIKKLSSAGFVASKCIHIQYVREVRGFFFTSLLFIWFFVFFFLTSAEIYFAIRRNILKAKVPSVSDVHSCTWQQHMTINDAKEYDCFCPHNFFITSLSSSVVVTQLNELWLNWKIAYK